MQLPKAIRVGNEDEAKMVVEVYSRPMLFAIRGEDNSERFLRVHPSGKVEDLTEKVHRAYALVSGSKPLKQGDMYGVSEKDARTRKSS